MDVLCPVCKTKLGKTFGDKLVLNGGSLISGSDFSSLLKCSCGEFAKVDSVGGIIKSDGNDGSTTEQQPTSQGGKDDSAGQPAGDDGAGAGSGSGSAGANDTSGVPLPKKPSNWIKK